MPKPPPAAPDDSNTNGMMVMAGMIGTTVSVFAFLIRSGSIREAGWSVADMGVQRRDAAMSASLMFVLSAAIVMTASATIHAHRLRMNEIADMVRLMEPIAGWIATTAFVVGIVAAGLSSHMPNMLVVPWFIRDYLGKERSTDTAWDRTVLFFLSLFSLLGTFLGFKPIPLMIFSQACIAVMLPLALGAVIVLTSRKSLMGRHANGIVDYIILSCIMVFALFMGYVGIQGVWNKLI